MSLLARKYLLEPEQKFGLWTVVSEGPLDGQRRTVLVRCVCGIEKLKDLYMIVQGKSTGCRKCASEKRRGQIAPGEKIGDWEILRELPSNGKRRYFQCRCICGTEAAVLYQALVRRNGSSKSNHCRKCASKDRQIHDDIMGIPGWYWYRVLFNAKLRGYAVHITHTEAAEVMHSQDWRCSLSGIPLDFSTSSTSRDGNASLDRIDSSLDYIAGNVQWVHKDVNRMKQDFREEEFIQMCRLVVDMADRRKI